MTVMSSLRSISARLACLLFLGATTTITCAQSLPSSNAPTCVSEEEIARGKALLSTTEAQAHIRQVVKRLEDAASTDSPSIGKALAKLRRPSLALTPSSPAYLCATGIAQLPTVNAGAVGTQGGGFGLDPYDNGGIGPMWDFGMYGMFQESSSWNSEDFWATEVFAAGMARQNEIDRLQRIMYQCQIQYGDCMNKIRIYGDLGLAVCALVATKNLIAGGVCAGGVVYARQDFENQCAGDFAGCVSAGG